MEKYFLSKKHNNTRYVIEQLAELLNRRINWYDFTPPALIGLENYNLSEEFVKRKELDKVIDIIRLILDHLNLEISSEKKKLVKVKRKISSA